MVAQIPKTKNRIREIRQQKGISQTELGKMVDVSEPAINRYEQGNRKPSREKMHEIAEALGVPLKTLFVNLEGERDEEGEEDATE